MFNRHFCGIAFLILASFMLSSCGLHRLAQGEPDFNTSQLLARQTDVKAPDGATRSQGLITVQAVAGENRPHGGAFYRTFLAWADPSAPPAAPLAIDGNGSLITLQIPLACNNADQAEVLTTEPTTAPEPAIASSTPSASSTKGEAENGKIEAAKPGNASASASADRSDPQAQPADMSVSESAKPETHSKGYPATKACYYALKTEIDQSYLAYMITLLHTVAYGNAATDIATEGLDLASSVTGAKTAKTILSAISTGLGASRTAIDKDILYDETITVIINQMEKDRAQSAAITTTALKSETAGNPYTISEIYNDLMGYYIAGTFSHALQELKSSTGAAKTNCQTAAAEAKLGGTKGKAAGQTAAASTTCASTPPSTGSSSGTIGLTAELETSAITFSAKKRPTITIKVSEINDAKIDIKLDPVKAENILTLVVFGNKEIAENPVEVKKQALVAAQEFLVFTLKSSAKAEVGEKITVTATGYDADGTVTGTKQLGQVTIAK